jgi:hypothetical protein
MTRVLSKWWWLVLLAYPVAGLVLGLADPALGRVAQQLGMKPGVATAVSVNALLPLVAVVLGLAHGRIGRAWIGAAAMTLGLVAGLATWYSGGVVDWSPAGLVGALRPVVVLAGLGYGILGTIAALAVRARRRPERAGETPAV